MSKTSRWPVGALSIPLKALCLAENANSSLHNVSTPRGAPIRDAKGWAYYLKEALRLFGADTEVLFTAHFWPRWGKKEIAEFIAKQAAAYKYIHDQTLRLANHGYTAPEIAEMVKLPDSLEREWYNHGYYGTVSHNTKAVYHKYLGWFDGNPANLNPLPPEEAGKKYVEFMGGAEQVIAKGERAFALGEYRWVAQVMNHVVFSDPENRKARHLAADALEQLGYQSESASWRNFYLSAAREMRHGVRKSTIPNPDGSDVVKTIPLDLLWDSVAVRLNGPKANGKVIKLNFDLTDTRQKCAVTVENSVLDCVVGTHLEDVDANVTITRASLNEIVLGKAIEEMIESGEVKISGNQEKLSELLSLLDKFEFWFNIAEP
jgi:alkyl sulfatase BDS1-like metallo-beta-lactamase superfamily hydrolase